MQPRDELYSLVDEQGRSATVNNGVVSFVSTPTPLPHTPDGWQEKSIKYARNITSQGMWRTFTTPLKYVKEAALMIRDQLYWYGTEKKLYQVIHRLDKRFTGGWVHRFLYKGELDLSQADDDDTSISVNIMEGDLIKLFKANESTEYEFDIDVPDAVIVKMDGLELSQTASFIVIDPETAPNNGNHSVPLDLLNQESLALNIKGVDRVQLGGSSGSDQNHKLVDEKLWFYDASTNKDISIEWDFYMTSELASGISPNPAVQLFLVIRQLRADGTLVNATTLNQFNGPTNVYRRNHFVGSTTITGIEQGASLYAFMGINIIGDTGDRSVFFTYDNDEPFKFNITKSVYRHRTTFIKGLRPAYMAQKLLDKITGGGYTFNSTFLNTVWENLLVTSGDAIRGFAGAKLKISWADFYASYNVPCNLTEGIRNQQLFIEKKEDAFKPTIQVALGQVRNMRASTKDAKDFQFNVVKIGYPNTQTEDVNGKDEFNVTQTYTSPITRSNKALELISKIIASMYEIELTRINLDGKTTTDDNNDNQAFFLHVEKTATTGTGSEPATYYNLLRNTYTSVTGLISPSTAFNLELHPELCLMRHGNYLRGVFYWQDAGNLVFQTSDKNGDVVVMQGTTKYIGNKTIRIGTLAPVPLFIPVVFKVEGPMPYDFVDKMDAGPDGTFSWDYGNDTYYGFPMDVGIQPANRPAQESTLLCSPQTDLTKLITISR